MTGGFLSGLRVRLLLLVLLAGLPSLGLILYTGLEQRRLAATQVQDNALRVARMASAEQERFIEGAHQLLTALARLPEVRAGQPGPCNALLADMLKQYPLYVNFGVTTADGLIICSAVPIDKPVPATDRAWYQRTVKTGTFAIGDYQIGRITGKPTVNFGYPLFDEDGKLHGVVYAALDLTWLNRLAAEARLPAGAALTVIDSRGQVLARYPESDKWVGKSAGEAPIVKTMLQTKGEGTAEERGMDDVPRLYAFAPLRGAKEAGYVYISIGIPAEVAYRDAERSLKRNLALLGAVAVLAVAGAWFGGNVFVLDRVKHLVSATKGLKAGDLSMRTGLSAAQGELGQLGQAFDEMATAVEERDAALRALNDELEQRVTERTCLLRQKTEQLEADLEMARELQQALLPQRYPTFPRNASPAESALCFTHRYLPTDAIGGDFFDVLPLSDTEAGVFICDVMGHGVRAALVTAMVRGLVEELSPIAYDAGQFLTELNRALTATLQGVGSPMFASALYMVADVRTGQLCFANAGHPYPIHLRRTTGVVESMRGAGVRSGAALGLFGDTVYPTCHRQLAADDLVVLFTDGLYEVYGAEDKQFGEEGLLASIRQRMAQPCKMLFDDLLEEIRQFSTSHQFCDDVCLLGMDLRRVGVAPVVEKVHEPAGARV